MSDSGGGWGRSQLCSWGGRREARLRAAPGCGSRSPLRTVWSLFSSLAHPVHHLQRINVKRI